MVLLILPFGFILLPSLLVLNTLPFGFGTHSYTSLLVYIYSRGTPSFLCSYNLPSGSPTLPLNLPYLPVLLALPALLALQAALPLLRLS